MGMQSDWKATAHLSLAKKWSVALAGGKYAVVFLLGFNSPCFHYINVASGRKLLDLQHPEFLVALSGSKQHYVSQKPFGAEFSYLIMWNTHKHDYNTH